MKKTEYFFVYETTNLINGKKYRGIHKTVKLDDKYLGSGTVFASAIKKYGRDNFKREILEMCNSYEELLEKEKIYVDEKWVKNRNNYNAKTGGQNSGILSEESKKKISQTLKQKYKNGEISSNIGNWIKENGNWLSNGGVTSEKSKENSSKSGKERFKNDENHPLKLFGNHIISDKQKEKISKTLKERYKKHVHPSKGKTHKGVKGKIPWNKGKTGVQEHFKFTKKKDFLCPYCNKLFDKANANRWHFDKCKLKPL